jgi:hypothetical protein
MVLSVKNLTPFTERLVGGDQQGSAFVTGGDATKVVAEMAHQPVHESPIRLAASAPPLLVE